MTWTNKPEKDMRFFAEIMLSCQDRAGLLVEISQAIYNLGYTISTVNARPVKNGATVINIGLEIGTATELTQLMERLRQIPSVESVYRVNS